MQGQRSSVEPFTETFEFDNVSSSSNSAMDQQMYWNNLLLDPVETQNLPDYLVSHTDANMSYVNMGAQDGARLSIWNSGGSSSREHSLNHGSCDEIKMEHGRTPARIVNVRGGPRIEQSHSEAARVLPLENVNINLNASQIDDEQSLQDANLNAVSQNSEHNAGLVGSSSEVSETRLCPHPTYAPGLLESDHVPSLNGPSNSCGNYSGGIGFMPEDGDGRPGSSLDGRRLACKRKNVEGVPGQSSASGSAIFIDQDENSLLHPALSSYNPATSLNIGSSSDYLSVENPYEEELNAGVGTIMRGAASESYPSAGTAGHAESSRRSFRIRMNPAHQHDISPPNLWSSGNTVNRFNVWSPNQPPFHPAPFSQPLEPMPIGASSSSQSQPHMRVIPGLPQPLYHFPWSGASSSRVGSSPISVNPEERVIALSEDPNSRNMTISNASDFVPTPDMRHLVQDRTNWNPSDRSTSIAGNGVPTSQTATSSGVYPTLGPTWVPHQNLPTRYPRSLSEVVRQSLFPSGVSESGGQTSNFSPQRPCHSITSQGRGHQSGAVFRGHQQQHMRSAFSVDRQNDSVLGVPLSVRSVAAAREGRSRMISEIRSALESMRRGENLRFEDIFILDQSMFYGGVDLHDRHRDMRLDVDNMSYEELLALEERIGNVSTGLSEEVILKCLKQRKYLLGTVEEASMEVEPCCICREEYVEGEDLGTLDCGHDFHTACIKQWLMHKNLCPICKNTALMT
ncbi:probable E3 ubiquitin-protein ligase HIP1 isoform X1 [Phoenix dactylifera]|uniref:RING-type E3 ubiquitin transferase n=1 Tax=Phoenix dactylifera TaxID=42345 RepID=A0A8B7C8D4_PHODC|nr:probable E3 ubiquitin-protein ligase HIP1 isoform X1 [Phoenix dactylifera]XP_017699017.2 probable E3 ubiquitin-protein ligase HIP1 isoform X1 [Phoenix dactylifera]